MFATGETVGLAEWIIDDTCLVWKYYWNMQSDINIQTFINMVISFTLGRRYFSNLPNTVNFLHVAA